MNHRIGLVALAIAGSLTTASRAQIAYVDQTRQVDSTTNGSCANVSIAPNFGSFVQFVECPLNTTASQNSTLGAADISCQGNTSSGFAPQTSCVSHSTLTVHFELVQDMHYTLIGQVGGPGTQAQVKLTGPSGIVHNPAGALSFNYCGTLPSGSYEINASCFGAAGSFSSMSFNLHIARAGDVNADQTVNVDDLVQVITNWGACAVRTNCVPDQNCDALVNVDDLVQVITNWG